MLENDELNDIPLATTFTIGTTLLGISTQHIQEIIKLVDITEVPRASGYILGILNLRGRIVTIIDLGTRLSLGACRKSDLSRIIIVDDGSETAGLLVDQVVDVIPIKPEALQPPPTNLNSIQGSFFENVYRSTEGLVGLLTLETILNHE
jgi:purine-binding chemotaxis protein CheW